MRTLLFADREPLAERLATGLGGEGIENSLVSDLESLRETLHNSAPVSLVYVAESRAGAAAEPDHVDAEAVFEACAEFGVYHLVVISSAMANEPSAHNLNMLPESKLAPRWTGNPLPDRWQLLEKLAQELVADHAERITILRTTALATAGGANFFSRLFRRRLAWIPPGFDPTLQVLSPDDLAGALAAVLVAPGTAEDAAAQSSGEQVQVFNVAPAGAVPLKQALRHGKVWCLPAPRTVQAVLRQLLAPLGLAAPVQQLDYLRYPWTVSGDKIRRQLGFEPRKNSVQAICEVREPEATGDFPSYDPFGLDKPYIRRLSRWLFPFLHDAYWRVEICGAEHVPREGGVVLTGVHRGFQPWDGVMAMYWISRQYQRFIRFLVHPSLVKFPFLAPYMIKLGGIPACRENGDWVLSRGKILAIFPEGIRGAFRLYGPDIYKLGKFGRDEYVRFALRNQVPIVPFVTVGSAEIYPIYGKIKWSWWKRLTEWPFLPVTPTLGTVPLPSKWHTRYLEPIHVEREHPPEAADDPAIVKSIGQQVKGQMAAALEDLVARRRHIYWGSIFDEQDKA